LRDALNRLLCITYANGTTEQASYHVHNNRKTVTDGNQSSRTNSYDLMNRLIARTIVPGNGVLGTAVETYKYDGLGRVVYAENSEPNGIIVATETFAYDSLGQLITQSLNGRTVSSVHDGAGNETALTYPGGRILTTSYDALNRKSVISDQGGAQLAQYFYVGPFREEGAFLGNNVLFGTAFDSARRPYVIEHVRDPNGTYTPIDLRTMLWDASSNKIRRVDLLQGLTHNLTYDSVDRMVASTLNTTPPTAISYTLDGVGNRTSVTGGQNPGAYTMDPNNPPGDAQMNQYTTTPMDARTYDSNGNLKQITGANPPAGTFVYDYQNRMVQFTDSLTSRQHSYAYDCFGRLIKKVVDTGGTPIETRYFYDGWQVVEERDGTDTVQATYVYGNYVDEVITMRRAGNDYEGHAKGMGSALLNVAG
jgi:YD repeat-containing protein